MISDACHHVNAFTLQCFIDVILTNILTIIFFNR